MIIPIGGGILQPTNLTGGAELCKYEIK